MKARYFEDFAPGHLQRLDQGDRTCLTWALALPGSQLDHQHVTAALGAVLLERFRFGPHDSIEHGRQGVTMLKFGAKLPSMPRNALNWPASPSTRTLRSLSAVAKSVCRRLMRSSVALLITTEAAVTELPAIWIDGRLLSGDRAIPA